MGKYFNPGNDGFQSIIKGNYVDKTGLIDLVNQALGKADERMICFSRPRRFGKSYAAKMLCAYYDISCDSKDLFDQYVVSASDLYVENRNRYNVLYLDITGFYEGGSENIVGAIRAGLVEDAKKTFGLENATDSLSDVLLAVTEKTGRKCIAIIDEWDAVFREESENEREQSEYITFLRSMFKNNNVTDKVFAGAYMTGILPIKKYGRQSAVSDFVEYTMTEPGPFAPYIGFTEDEVKALCNEKGADFKKMKNWYDGYDYPQVGAIYNPNSVMKSLKSGLFKGYWTQSETFLPLRDYIAMDFDGLRESIVAMMGGDRVRIDAAMFQNDMTSISNRDDVLTLLVHLGYLAYDVENACVSIPNEEILKEYERTLRNSTRKELVSMIHNSDRMLEATLRMDGDAIAGMMGEIHENGVAPLQYNDEATLRYVIRFAYLSAVDDYVRIEELPSGHGYADIVFIPKDGIVKPALLVELKWNKPVDGAIEQIRNRNYPAILQSLGKEILLVGISYDEKTKEHSCVVEKV